MSDGVRNDTAREPMEPRRPLEKAGPLRRSLDSRALRWQPAYHGGPPSAAETPVPEIVEEPVVAEAFDDGTTEVESADVALFDVETAGDEFAGDPDGDSGEVELFTHQFAAVQPDEAAGSADDDSADDRPARTGSGAFAAGAVAAGAVAAGAYATGSRDAGSDETASDTGGPGVGHPGGSGSGDTGSGDAGSGEAGTFPPARPSPRPRLSGPLPATTSVRLADLLGEPEERAEPVRVADAAAAEKARRSASTKKLVLAAVVVLLGFACAAAVIATRTNPVTISPTSESSAPVTGLAAPPPLVSNNPGVPNLVPARPGPNPLNMPPLSGPSAAKPGTPGGPGGLSIGPGSAGSGVPSSAAAGRRPPAPAAHRVAVRAPVAHPPVSQRSKPVNPAFKPIESDDETSSDDDDSYRGDEEYDNPSPRRSTSQSTRSEGGVTGLLGGLLNGVTGALG